MKKLSAAQKIFFSYLIALIPLILYGIYKNGYLVYSKGFINIFTIFKPLLLPIIAIVLSYLVELIFSIRSTLSKAKANFKNTFLPLYGLIISCLVQPNISILLFSIVLFGSFIIIKLLNKIKFLSFNNIALIKLLFVIILLFFFNSSYLNNYEANVHQAIDGVDYLFGRYPGGIASTSAFLAIIGYIFLCFRSTYKKEIPLTIIVTYSLLTIPFVIVFKDINILWELLLANSVFFGAIFIAPEMMSSPYSKRGKTIYGILIGIFTFVCVSFISPLEGVFIAILFVSLFTKIIDKICEKFNKKQFLD